MNLETIIKNGLVMKAKVRISDKYTGRSINLIVNLENTFGDKYEFSYSKLSSYQRSKIEKIFGKINAYYTNADILKTF